MIWSVISFAGGFILGSLWDTIFEPVRKAVASALKPFDLNVEQLADLAVRGEISEADYIARAAQWGFDESRAKELLALRRALFGVSEIYRAWRLGLMSDAEKNEALKKLGFNDSQIAILDKITQEYPSASDIVRFAVREVFSEDVVRKYGYDQDIPQAYIEWAKRLGLSEEFARWYWRAHWEIPSPTQAIELLARGVIDVDDVATVLKIHDIAPYWRPRLMALAFDPYTRVDVRRMYELGILTDDDLIKAARAVGYATEEDLGKLAAAIGDPAIAQSLFVGRAEAYAAWIKSEVLEPWRNDVIRAIRRAYVNGLIDRQRARQYMLAVGYNERLVDTVLDYWDVSEALDALSDRITELAEACRAGQISVEQMTDELRQLGVEDRIIRRAQLRCLARQRARRSRQQA
jgi:hypothetical protein